MERKFRAAHRRTASKPRTAEHVQALGVRVGWWPCLRAPFAQVTIGSHIFEMWYGLPSYR